MSEIQYNVKETKIQTAGVFRCCTSSVAREYEKSNQSVGIGAMSKCIHCERAFKLENKYNEMVWTPINQ